MSGLRIAIDGPSGAGKSTLARALAERLGLPYVDTGAMYRAVGYVALREGAETEAAVRELLAGLELGVDPDPRAFRVRVSGEDVTAKLRDTAVSMRASEVAQIPAVRAWLVALQRQLAADGAVLEGRDIGSQVIPDADLKLFITASEDVRMQRRAAQLGGADTSALSQEIRERDRRDRERTSSPLRVAEGAVVIDTSDETAEASLEAILARLERLPKPR